MIRHALRFSSIDQWTNDNSARGEFKEEGCDIECKEILSACKYINSKSQTYRVKSEGLNLVVLYPKN